ncbi:MAG: hypothetical protein QOC54_2155 [Baekduia sp.]|nr:hypothetical protein [Baekduia sp.]
MRATTTRARAALVAGLTTVALLAAAVSATQPASTQAADPAAVVASLAADYPVLARPASPDDLAEDRPITPAELALGMPELLPDSGRLLARNDDRSLVLIPRDDGRLCLAALFADGQAGIDCDSTGTPPVLATYGRATGVVPLEVHEVVFTLADGSHQTADATGGRYDAPPEAKLVAYTTDDGPQAIDLMPVSTLPPGVRTPPL